MAPQSIDELLQRCYKQSNNLDPKSFKEFITSETEDYIQHNLTLENQHTIDEHKKFIIDTILKSVFIQKNLKKLKRKNPWGI